MTELNFTEVEPFGPQVHGDLDLGQLHDSWSRRVAAEFTGDQTYWAVITWSWYQCELANGEVVLLREEEYMITTDSPTRPGDGEEFSDYRYPEPLAVGDKEDKELARRAAAEADLSLMTWPEEMANKIELWQQL
jgi:hypothetical protein